METKAANGVALSRTGTQNNAGFESRHLLPPVGMNLQDKRVPGRRSRSPTIRSQPVVANSGEAQPKAAGTQATAPRAEPVWLSSNQKWRLRRPIWRGTSTVDTALPTTASLSGVIKSGVGVQSTAARASAASPTT